MPNNKINGAESSRAKRKFLNELRPCTDRWKLTLKKWGYLNTEDVTRACDTEPQIIDHLRYLNTEDVTCARDTEPQTIDHPRGCSLLEQ